MNKKQLKTVAVKHWETSEIRKKKNSFPMQRLRCTVGVVFYISKRAHWVQFLSAKKKATEATVSMRSTKFDKG